MNRKKSRASFFALVFVLAFSIFNGLVKETQANTVRATNYPGTGEDVSANAIVKDFEVYNSNHEKITEITPITGGAIVDVEADISVSSNVGKTLKAGDYFKILPLAVGDREIVVISAADSFWEDLKDASSTVIGQYRIKTSAIEIVFNEKINGAAIANVKINTGPTNYVNVMNNDIDGAKTELKVGNKSKMYLFQNPLTPQSLYNRNITMWRGNTGYGSTDWLYSINRDSFYELATSKGRQVTSMENVYAENELIDGAKFIEGSMIFYTFIPKTMQNVNPDDTTLATAARLSIHVTKKFTRVHQITGETYDQFKARLAVLDWGIYVDPATEINTIVTNYGNLGTNGLSYTDPDIIGKNEDIGDYIQSRFGTTKVNDVEKEILNKTFGKNNVVGGAMMETRVSYKVSYDKVSNVPAIKKNAVGLDAVKSGTPIIETANANTLVDTTGGIASLEKRSVTIYKSDKDTGLPLSKAKFKLQYQDAGTWKDYTNNAGELEKVSDADGKISFLDLPLGTFKIVETEATTGYDKDTLVITDSNGIQMTTFTILSNDAAGVMFLAKNSKALVDVDIEIRKVDVFTNVGLEGAVFSLYDADTNIELQTDLRSDVDGGIHIPLLPAGKYELVETEAPEGYELNTTPLSFQVLGTETTSIKLRVPNARKIASVQLKKLDENGTPLEGAKFKLTNKIDSSLTYTATSDLSGNVNFPQVAWGGYLLTEIKAPDGYLLDKTYAKDVVVNTKQLFVDLGSVTNKKMVLPNEKDTLIDIIVTDTQIHRNVKTGDSTDRMGYIGLISFSFIMIAWMKRNAKKQKDM